MPHRTELQDFDRRNVLTGLGAALSLGIATSKPAFAQEPDRALETEKEKIVNDFCAAWSLRDAAQLLPYLDETVEYHMFEGAPPISGLEMFQSRLQPFMADMREIEWEILRSTVMGDIVLNERIDHFLRKEGSEAPDNHFHIVGVFLIRDGKIKYWKDYNLSGVL